jgi:hypothetical protein
MNPSLGQRFRLLFKAESGVELVLVGNAYAAVALGITLLFEADLSMRSSLYAAAATFRTADSKVAGLDEVRHSRHVRRDFLAGRTGRRFARCAFTALL